MIISIFLMQFGYLCYIHKAKDFYFQYFVLFFGGGVDERKEEILKRKRESLTI